MYFGPSGHSLVAESDVDGKRRAQFDIVLGKELRALEPSAELRRHLCRPLLCPAKEEIRQAHPGGIAGSLRGSGIHACVVHGAAVDVPAAAGRIDLFVQEFAAEVKHVPAADPGEDVGRIVDKLLLGFVDRRLKRVFVGDCDGRKDIRLGELPVQGVGESLVQRVGSDKIELLSETEAGFVDLVLPECPDVGDLGVVMASVLALAVDRADSLIQVELRAVAFCFRDGEPVFSLTSLINADVAGECFRWAALLGSRVYIRYARYMHVRDFERGNFVVVGSRRSNPWTSLFERNLNFSLEEDPTTHTFHFRNRRPNPGEPEIYAAQYEGSGVHIGYVDIAILPNLTGTGTVLLFNGLRMENDEAASNLIFSGDTPPSLTHALASVSRTSTTEILLRVRSLGGAENGWEVVSVHSSNH